MYNQHITVGSHAVGEVDFVRMYGKPGLGFYRLIVELKFRLYRFSSPTDNRAILSNLRAGLFLKFNGEDKILATRLIRSDSEMPLSPKEHKQEFRVEFEGEFDREKLFSIEKLRQGDDLQVEFDIYSDAKVPGDDYSNRCDITMRFQRTQSDWVKLLEQMQYKKTLLLEVPEFDKDINPELNTAVEHLKQAHSQYNTGYYRNTIGECRDALEFIANYFDDSGEIPEEVKGWIKRDDTLTKEQRYAKIIAMLFKLAHLARHSDSTSAQTQWLPEDAQGMLSMTAALLNVVNNKSEGR